MYINTNWNIITGAPCSGKTKVIEHLSFLGYKTYPEVARILVDNYYSKGYNINTLREEKSVFEKLILDEKLGLEKRTNPFDECFFDRGIIDSQAFICLYGVNNLDVNKWVNFKYKNVFLLEPLDYVIDDKRFENENESVLVETFLRSAYSEFNYQLINVPKMSIEERCYYILNRLK